MRKYFFNNIGLSLVELMVTISILAILAGMSVYHYVEYRMTTMYNSVFATLEQSKFILTEYYLKNKTCPNDGSISRVPTGSTSTFWSSINNNTVSNNCRINIFDKNTPPKVIISWELTVNTLGDISYICIKGSDYKQSPLNNSEVVKYLPKDCT
jgi:prepilin-type N-terminal cleavage/methylation domain-containing protein